MTATATAVDSDRQIQKDVLAELTWDARVAPTEIGVSVKNGVVTLTGFVDSYIKKWAAEEATHRVRGVRAVANDIEVRLPSSGERTDADIAAAALQEIEWDVFLPADKITVTVSKGWVTLRGEVEWQFQRQAAERHVRSLKGLTGVTNLITVAPRVKPSDLQKKIEDALVRSAQLDAHQIKVDVEGTRAILGGAVRSLAEKKEAERAAWLAPGITAVDNRITISTN
jgi:osmotically-inducible protein OsmY